MAFFFAKSSMGFYNDAINKIMPADAVSVSDEAYAAIFNAHNSGSLIDADANGNPIAIPPLLHAQAQKAGGLLLASGLQIKSKTFPSLDGTYSLSSNSLLNLTGLMTYVEVKNAFPGGTSTLTWFDQAGVPHIFTTVAEFQTLADAVCTFVTQVHQYMTSGGQVGPLPSALVTIP